MEKNNLLENSTVKKIISLSERIENWKFKGGSQKHGPGVIRTFHRYTNVMDDYKVVSEHVGVMTSEGGSYNFYTFEILDKETEKRIGFIEGWRTRSLYESIKKKSGVLVG